MRSWSNPIAGFGAVVTAISLVAPWSASHLSAQGWTAHASVGQVESDRLPVEASFGAQAGIGWTGDRSGVMLSGGTPFDDVGPRWAALGAGAERPVIRRGPLSITLNLAASGFVYQLADAPSTGFGGTLQGMPTARIDLGRAWITAGSGPAVFAAREAGLDHRRVVLSNHVELTAVPTVGVRVGGFARLVQAEEGRYPLAALTGSLSRGSVIGWVTAGRWLANDLDDPLLDVGVSVALGDRFTVVGRYHLDPSDPLVWSEGRRGISVGASMRLSGPPSSRRSSAPIATNGETVFRVPARPDLSAVWIAGEFTDWERVPLVREDGYWRVALRIEPGVYHFAFIDDQERWFLPAGISRVDDGMGGESGVLVID